MAVLMEIFQYLRRPLNTCAINVRAGMLAMLLLLGVIPVNYSIAADAASITAAVASGKPLSDIIRKSLAEGMKMTDIVAALTAAKVPADRIVYTTITEGLSSCDIISEGIHAGGNVTQIVTAAKSAGCTDSAITDAAMSAGANSTEVASALASSQSGAGYSAPTLGGPRNMFNAPGIGSPTTGGGGGGGGGGKAVSPSSPNQYGGYK